MKTITKELNLLDIEDIEKAVSKSMNREVKIGEIDCTLTYCIPSDTNIPNGMFLDFWVKIKPNDFGTAGSFELFGSDTFSGLYLNVKKISLSEPWLPVEEMFGFNVSAFKSFEILHDLSPNKPDAVQTIILDFEP